AELRRSRPPGTAREEGGELGRRLLGVLGEEGVLRREVEEERGARDVRLAADLVDGDGVEALRDGEPHGGREEVAARTRLLPRTEPVRLGGLDHMNGL